ncbi:hypothetical protein SADUNF_Sadunf10G0026500 [Salix dunnii]|uniref:Uncharacterized protein n=1 Tax=Salix dunnii TaxID=1413687 RepID=A0A835JRW2_9ROSI|nr:hypothetical protein SADUNF_Sadunf10G0026500 [Salix dunnii]
MQASPKVNERSITAATESAETVLFSNDMNPHLPPLVQDQEEEEEEFSFLCTNPSGSLISADDIFQNGQIRPIFPLFNRDGGPLFIDEDKAAAAAGGPLMFVEERNEADGPSCVWTRGSKALPDQQMCKKSNSTGFSKLRRFREFVLRSNSDGKDAFVFLNHKDSTSKHLQETITTTAAASEMKGHEKTTAKKDVVAEKRKEQSSKRVSSSSSSAHELHYLRNRAIKDGEKQKSYLPYRQDIFGFFTNVNDLSRNIHPF